MARGRSLSIGLVGLAGLVCTACPNPNTFTTARTVPAGSVSHSVSIEAIGSLGETSAVLPTPPSYTARIGVADTMELGLHFSHLSSLGLDFKWNPVKSEAFDFAIMPGGQAFFIAGGGDTVFVYALHMPLLFDINFSPSTTMVLAPGITYYGTTGTVDSDFGVAASTLMARAGIGFDFRTSKKFAVHPEVTFLIPFEDTYNIIFLGGVGFNFGSLPDFGQ